MSRIIDTAVAFFHTLPPEAPGLGVLCVLLLLACLGWAHCASTSQAALVQSMACAEHWKREAKRLTQRNLNLTLAQTALTPAPKGSPAQKSPMKQSPSGVKWNPKQTSPDWADNDRDTVVDLQKALTLVWHRPELTKTPLAGGVVKPPPQPMMKRPPNGLLRPHTKRSV